MSPNHDLRFIGIDVAGDHLDLAVRPSGEYRRFQNTVEGIDELVEFVKSQQAELVVAEATGKLEIPVAAALTVAAIPVAIVNPRQGRDFAKAQGQIAKTDQIDAAVLANVCRCYTAGTSSYKGRGCAAS